MKALVTGASSGIGKEMAIYLSKLNFELILVAKDKEKLEELQNEVNTLKDKNIYEKEEKSEGKTLNVVYDLEHEKIDILYSTINYTEKIAVDYQLNVFQTVVFNNNDIDNISEKYIFDLKKSKNNCEIGECTTLKNTRKLVEKYLFQLQVE